MRAIVLFAFALAGHTAPSISAERSPACEAKRASIEAQISQAKSAGRTRQLAGLRKALQANKAHCTDELLAQQRDAEIREARQEVAEREEDLREAEEKGDARKISSRRAKLDEARRDLAEAEKPLAR